ncbi:MAG: phenylalanine--tRNA ligase subunit beta [Cyanophyceae cyanobacterium]
MRISLKWLRELVDFELTPTALGEALTMAGFEVEDIEDRTAWAEGVVVGKILTAEPHPNADRLQVCQVDLGASAPSTIVCGAANARAGLTVAVAVPGVYLPTIDLKLKKAKLRGVPSEGMICSLKELGLEKESDGIHEFAEAHPPGSDVRPLLGLDDVILDLTSTANRADALSMVGIAREVAALTRNPVHLPPIPAVEAELISGLTLQVADTKACPAYSGTLIKGVTIGPSPLWLQRRLEAMGSRSINNVVDITNLVLLEWGQPLHAFDWAKLQTVMKGRDSSVGVRLAQPGETLKTLDGNDRKLAPQNLVITAGDHPVALAGVMGGEATEVQPQSVDIFLEAALFDPVAIRRSARAQGLRTEASSRYERGVNVSALLMARNRAVALILELAGGSVVGQTVADHRPPTERSVQLRLSRLIDVMGDDIKPADVEEILPALGFEMSPCETLIPQGSSDTLAMQSIGVARCVWQVRVPPYRLRDIEREIDLIEEFARLYGYDRFSETLPPETAVGSLSGREAALRRIREACRGVGLTELIHPSLCAAESGVEVVISNPMSPEFSALRGALLPGLLQAFQYNWDRKTGALCGFEVGRIFGRNGDGYREADYLGGILGGNPTLHTWQHKHEGLDWYEAKGILMAIFERLGLPVVAQVPETTRPELHPGRTASLWLGEQELGYFAQVHPQTRQAFDLPDQVYVFELDAEPLVAALEQGSLVRYQPFSAFPASDRDLALFSPLTTSVAELETAIRAAAGSLLESVDLFDEYRGQGVPEGQRSLAFRMVYRAFDRTLTDAEVEAAQQQVRTRLEQTFQVQLRS